MARQEIIILLEDIWHRSFRCLKGADLEIERIGGKESILCLKDVHSLCRFDHLIA